MESLALLLKLKWTPSLTLCLCFALLLRYLSLSTKLVIKGRLISHFLATIFWFSLFLSLSLWISPSVLYLVGSVMFRHSWWSLRSPQPPLPLRNLDFFRRLGTVIISERGKSWCELRAIRSTCCTLEITWFDSQFLFLWCTPLCSKRRRNISVWGFPFCYMYFYSPLANVENARPLYDHGMQLPLQTLLRHMLQRPVPVVVVVRAEVPCTPAYTLPGGTVKGEAHVVLATDPRHRLHLDKESNEWD